MNALRKTGLMLLLMLAGSFAVLAQDATEQKCTSWEAYPEGTDAAKQIHSLYREHLKNENYEKAFELWKKVFEHVTSPEEVPRRHFEDGAVLYLKKANATEDTAAKNEFIEKAISLYDQNVACVGEDATLRAWQVSDMYYEGGVEDLRLVKAGEKAMEVGGKETPSVAIAPFTVAIINNFYKKKLDKAYMRDAYKQIKGIVEHNIANNNNAADYQEAWDYVKEAFASYEKYIFDCDFFVEKNKPIFAAEKSNPEVREQILVELEKGNCKETEAFFQEVMSVHQPYLDSIQRVKDSLEFAAYPNWKKGDVRKRQDRDAEAMKYYEKTLDLAASGKKEEGIDNERLADIAYQLAYDHYKKGSYSTARSYARKASNFRPNWGEPYLLVGTMYASSGSRCSEAGVGFEAQVVTWAAVDEWQRAKSVDASAAAKANAKISQYSQYYPTVEDLFTRDLKEGQSYKVGCWIGVTTTIRAKK